MRISRVGTTLVAAAAALTLLGGCNRATPEERLQRAIMLYQQQDPLGAMLEAQDLIKKHPETPEAVNAHMLLAQVYLRDRRPDEALAELDVILQRTSQREVAGVEALRTYISILQQTGRFDQALQTIEKYAKQYEADAGVSQNLKVARAQTLSYAGRTTESVAMLDDMRGKAESAPERRVYVDLMREALLSKGEHLRVAALLQEESAVTTEPEVLREYAGLRTIMFSREGDYDATRAELERATALYDEAIGQELDRNVKAQLLVELSGLHIVAGSLKAADTILRKLYVTEIDERLYQTILQGIVDILMRQDKVDETLALLREADKRFPDGRLGESANELEEIRKRGELGRMNLVDTSPLTMKFLDAEPVLPANLPPKGFEGPAPRPSAPAPPARTEGAPATSVSAFEAPSAVMAPAPETGDETTSPTEAP